MSSCICLFIISEIGNFWKFIEFCMSSIWAQHFIKELRGCCGVSQQMCYHIWSPVYWIVFLLKNGYISNCHFCRVGFNSVYHLTDLPSFVSGKHVVIFDPQGCYLPNISAANPGKRIEYVSSSAIKLYTDQLLPYCAFGSDMKSPFHGTLFRFPLRNADQAANSKLSKQSYLEDDITAMFVQLYEEGILSLLFLKCLISIEMYVWDLGMPEPTKMYSCSINSANDDVLWHRQEVHRSSQLKFSSDPEMDAFPLDFVSEAVSGDVSQIKKHKFYVVQMMASPSSRIGAFAAMATKEYDMHLLPWASVAACISDDSLNVILLHLW